MSLKHITAARYCSMFKGNTRLLLNILCDRAGSGKDRYTPFGWTPTLNDRVLMATMNTKRRKSMWKWRKELVDAGVVKGERVFGREGWPPSKYFVDIEWLEAHQRTWRKAPHLEDEELISQGAGSATHETVIGGGFRQSCVAESAPFIADSVLQRASQGEKQASLVPAALPPEIEDDPAKPRKSIRLVQPQPPKAGTQAPPWPECERCWNTGRVPSQVRDDSQRGYHCEAVPCPDCQLVGATA